MCNDQATTKTSPGIHLVMNWSLFTCKRFNSSRTGSWSLRTRDIDNGVIASIVRQAMRDGEKENRTEEFNPPLPGALSLPPMDLLPARVLTGNSELAIAKENFTFGYKSLVLSLSHISLAFRIQEIQNPAFHLDLCLFESYLQS